MSHFLFRSPNQLILAVILILRATMICNKCNENLPAASFEANRKTCKTCRKKAIAETKEANKRKAKELAEKGEYPPPPTKCANKNCEATTLTFEKRFEVVGWRNTCCHCLNYASGKYARANSARSARLKVDDEYRAERNAKNRAWATKNPEKVRANQEKQSEKRRQDVDTKFKSIIFNGKSRKIDFVHGDAEAMKAKLEEPCHYCGRPTDEELSTLDRLDSTLDYSDANTVPSCKFCNTMKGQLGPDLFIHKARSVHENLGAPAGDWSDLDAKYANESTSKFGKPFASEIPKTKAVEITEEEAVKMWCSPCNYCATIPSFGVDRVDSDANYTLGNSVPCCTICNTMKKDMVVEEFAYRVAKIVAHTEDWTLADFRDNPVLDAGRAKKFYKVDAGGGKPVVFPSDRLFCGRMCRSVKGAPATPREFWEQNVTTEDFLAAYKNRTLYNL